jgi:hypothetical protein
LYRDDATHASFKARNFDERFAAELDPSVRDRYLELELGVRTAPS